MAPVLPDKTPKKKSWSEVNKARKEEKKKRKEKKLKKNFLNEQIEETNEEEIKDEAIEPLPEHNIPTTEPTIKKPTMLSTLSLAVAGSILENAQSPELRTYLAGQIARAACIFQVDEVIVFDDYGDEVGSRKSSLQDNHGLKTARTCCTQLGRILQYLECPQYLRKSFFPIHKDLKFSGILNPLNAPHHLGINDYFPYREGVVTNKAVKQGRGSLVNVGLYNEVTVDKLLTPGIRCTVKLDPENNSKKLKGTIVSPSEPRLETGAYWGYSVRLANSLAQVFSQCPYKNGYDLTLGTSDKGVSIDEFQCPLYKHSLIMFGGLQGLEAALENDLVLKVDDPKLLFDYYLNTLPQQGSKTIRTEEAVLVSLAALRPKLNPEFAPISLVECGQEEPLVNVDEVMSKDEMNVDVDELDRFD